MTADCICRLHPMYARIHGCEQHGFAVPIGDVAGMIRYAAKSGRCALTDAIRRLACERPTTWRDDLAMVARGLHPVLQDLVQRAMTDHRDGPPPSGPTGVSGTG